MHVLHVSPGNLYGGIETLLFTLAHSRHLCPEMESSFALCFGGRLREELSAAAVPLHILGGVRTSLPWTVLRVRRAFRRLLGEQSPDVVLTHGSWSHAVFGSEARKAGIALVTWLHSPPGGRHWLERWARRTPPDLAICNSRFTALNAHCQFDGVPTEVVYVPLPNPFVAKSERRIVRQKFGVEDDTIVILQVSRMEECKGHELHLLALARLPRSIQWTCWFVGGSQREEEAQYMMRLRARTRDLGIQDRVLFLGKRSDVPVLMASADIFCQPNKDPEGFGIVFVEALQAGLPVVTTRLGGAMEIVDDTCGVLVPPGDVASLADTLRTLIEKPEQRSILGLAGPSRAQTLCNPEKQIVRLHQKLKTFGHHRRDLSLEAVREK